MDLRKLENKKLVFCYSDPGGAKMVLSIAHNLQSKNEVLILANRNFDFTDSFNLNVVICEIEAAGKIIKSGKYDLLISGTSYTNDFELSIISLCKVLNIFSCVCVDNWSGFKERLFRDGKYILPNKIYVIDEIAKKNAMDSGIEQEWIEIFENPYWNYLKKWKPFMSKEHIFLEYGLSLQKKTICIAPDPLSNVGGIEKFGFDEYSALEEIINKISPEKFNIVVKVHPNQNMNLLFKNLQNSQCTIITSNIHHNHLIYFSDLVISFFSNILIEAKYLGSKPLRYIDKLNSNDSFEENSIEIYDNSKIITDYI